MLEEKSTECPRCGGARFVRKSVPKEHPDFGRAIPCGACKEPPKPTGIPQGREKNTFESWKTYLNPMIQHAYLRCIEVAEGSKWCAFLAGTPGNGKTHLAVAALNMRQTGVFWKVPDILDHIRERAFGESSINLSDMLKAYRSSPALLVLDDLGVEKRTEWAAEQLYRILDSRSDAKLPTIITTNADLDAIDGRLRSRYSEGLVICKGGDMRRRGL